MKEARYMLAVAVGDFGERCTHIIKYDETAPCRGCGLPVIEASMGGTDICPWCDCGTERPEIKQARDLGNK